MSATLTATSPACLEENIAGQIVVLQGAGGTAWANSTSPITISNGTITAQAVNHAAYTVTLTVTAPNAIESVTFTDSVNSGHPTVALPVTKTPAIPASVTRGTLTRLYNFTLSWTAAAPIAGETITYRVYKNGSTELTTAPGQSGLTLAVTGAASGDVFTVKSEANSLDISAARSFTFIAPSGFGNDPGTDPVVPTISPALNYQGEFTVFRTGTETITLASSDGADVIYTLDGSEPVVGIARIYTAPVVIGKTTLLKAVAVAGGRRSATVTRAFLRQV